jgi:rhodanese-related sulfurtransferase
MTGEPQQERRRSASRPRDAAATNNPSWGAALRDAAIVVALSAALSLGLNSVRSSGRIPLVAKQPYDVIVPCPEHQGSAAAITAAQLATGEKGLVLVDGRDRAAYAAWHLPGSLSLPYDYLEPPTVESVKQLLRTRARRVVIYGDGENPDSGEQLARELNRKGVKNVSFVAGGAPALRARGGGGAR